MTSLAAGGEGRGAIDGGAAVWGLCASAVLHVPLLFFPVLNSANPFH